MAGAASTTATSSATLCPTSSHRHGARSVQPTLPAVAAARTPAASLPPDQAGARRQASPATAGRPPHLSELAARLSSRYRVR